MHHSRWALCATLLWVSSPLQAEPPTSGFEVRLLRVEGAAAGVRRSAERLAEIANKISNSGNLSNITQLHNERFELHRMVIGARMATEMAIQEMKAKNTTD